jgi:hypothetical protein
VTTRRTFPGRISIRRQVSPIDVVVGLGLVALLYGPVRIGTSLSVTIIPGASSAALPTGLSHIPFYAASSKTLGEASAPRRGRFRIGAAMVKLRARYRNQLV